MVNLGGKFHLGRLEGIVDRQQNIQIKESSGKGRSICTTEKGKKKEKRKEKKKRKGKA
jgi:hypothetical protein